MKAKDLMTGPPATLDAESTVQEAAALMKEGDIGALPVYGVGNPCGIITDRDIAVNVVAAGKGVATQVGEVCTLSAITVDPDTDIAEVARQMKTHQIRRLPVVRDGIVEGMISLADIALARQALGGEALSAISQPRVSLGAATGPIGRNPLPADLR